VVNSVAFVRSILRAIEALRCHHAAPSQQESEFKAFVDKNRRNTLGVRCKLLLTANREKTETGKGILGPPFLLP